MIDKPEIDNIKKKNPANAKNTNDILYFSNMYNKHYLNKNYPQPGIHEFLNEPERKQSKKDWPKFNYHINECGFRDQLPAQDDDNIIGFFGCSVTFGEGMDSKENFPMLLAEDMKMTCLNLGQPGFSAENTALVFDAAANIWNMKVAVVTMPVWSRFMYMEKSGYINTIIPSYAQAPGESEDVRKAVMMNFSDHHLMFAFVRSVNNIITVAKSKGIKLVFGTWHYESQQLLREVFGYEAPNLDNDYNVMTARDGSHPHPDSCYKYYEKLKDVINKEGYV